MEAQQVEKVLSETAAQREDAMADKPMTISEAINWALWMRRTPDGLLSPEIQRRTVAALLSALESSPCFFKAVQKGEEVFVLRQQDRVAPKAIRTWAVEAEQHGCGEKKVIHAFQIAKAWEGQDQINTKWPD